MVNPHIPRNCYKRLVCMTPNLSAHLSILMSSLSPDDVCNQPMYQTVVGSLLYLSTKTRPDNTYAVSRVTRFCGKPIKEHWTAVKRVLRFLKGTSNFGLLYREDQLKSPGTHMQIGPAMLETGNQPLGMCSFWEVLLLAGRAANRLAWLYQPPKRRMLLCLLLPLWLQQLASDLLNKSIRETTILEDNQSTICRAKKQQIHGRTKHIDKKYHFVCDLVEAGRIKLTYFASEDKVADMLTKGLPIKQFEKLRRLAGIAEFAH